MVPLQEEFADMSFDAPIKDDLAGLSTTCPIRLAVDYSFTANSQIDVSVINEQRLTEIQRSGEAVTYTPTLNVGRGPIKIKLSFGANLPIKEGKTFPVYVSIENKGDGLYAEIPGPPDVPVGRLNIMLPKDFTVTNYDSKFELDGRVLTNIVPIPLIKKKTTNMGFSLTAPGEDFEKTHFISASLDYEYTITDERKVPIQPTA